MINAVKIENFQSLKNVKFDLGAITVIHGPSGTGKSAVARALRSLITNNLTGMGHVTYGATVSKVTAVFDGSDVVQICKGSSNKFIVVKDNEKKIFDKIGRDVPGEVSALMNMPSISFDSDLVVNFNIQSQHDSPFLLTRAGDAAKIIGRLSHLNVIFIALREANKEKKKYSSEVLAKSALIESTEVELNKFDSIKDEEEALAVLTKTVSLASSLEAKIKAISSVREEFNNLKELDTSVLSFDENSTSAFIGKAHDLITLSSKLEEIKAEYSLALEKKVDCIIQLDKLNLILAKFSLAEDKIAREALLLNKIKQLHELESSINNFCTKRDAIEQELVDAEKNRLQILRELKVCPTCGQRTDIL